MPKDYINIDFPFKDDPKGNFLSPTVVDERAIKADLVHLLLTEPGERLYLPEFGVRLRRHIFKPNLEEAHEAIKEDIKNAVAKWMPMLTINDLKVTPGNENEERNEHHALVELGYTINKGVYKVNDSVIISI